MSDVFISYSRRDIAFARLIRESLQQSDIDTWIDWERIPVGERWWQEICQAIENANVFMFIISQQSIGSKVCRDEIDQALKNHKRIIPILVDDLTPEAIQAFAPELPQYNWIIFQRDQIFSLEGSGPPSEDEVALPRLPQFQEALARLNTAIHTDWDWVKYHTRLQVDALRWQHNQSDPSYLAGGAALEEAEQRLFQASGKEPQPTGLQVQYVTTSRQHETLRQNEQLRLEQRARQRQRLALWAVALGLIAASILGALAWSQRNQYLAETHVRATAEAVAVNEAYSRATAQAEAVSEAQARATAQVEAEIASTQAVEQRNEAVRQAGIAFGRQLSAQAVSLGAHQLDQGLLLAIEANHHLDSSEPRRSLLEVLQTQPMLQYYLKPGGWGLGGLAFSPDGRWVAVGTLDHQVWLVEAATGAVEAPPLVGLEAEVLSLAFSPDGRYLAGGDDFGAVVFWDLSRLHDPQPAGGFHAGAELSRLQTVFTSDIRVLMEGYFPSEVFLWNLPPAQTFMACECGAASLSFTPDSRSLAVGLGNGMVTLWDLATQEQIALYYNPPYGPTGTQPGLALDLAISPDGTRLAAATTNGMLRTWEVETSRLLGGAQHGQIMAVIRMALHPDGNTVAYSLSENKVYLYDMETEEIQSYELPQTSSPVLSLAFDPDGATLALGLADTTILMWDMQSRRPVGAPLAGHAGEVIRLAFSPDGRQLASLDWEHTLILWDLDPAQRLLTVIEENAAYAPNTTLSADGRYLAALVGKSEPFVYPTILQPALWDLHATPPISQELPADLVAPYLSIETLRFLGESHNLLVHGFEPGATQYDTSNHVTRLWDLDAGVLLQEIRGARVPLALNASGTRLIARTGEEAWGLWDLSNGTLLRSVGAIPKLWNGSIALSPDGSLLAIGMHDGTLQLWHTGTGAQVTEVKSHYGHILRLAFSPDGALLASASRDKTILVWNVSQLVGGVAEPGVLTGEPVLLTGHTSWVMSVAFSPDGRSLASSSLDGTIRLWDLESGGTIGVLSTAQRDRMFSLDFREDGTLLVSSGSNKILTWEYGLDSWKETACAIAQSNFSLIEWRAFFGDEPYRKTCPDHPLPGSVVEAFLTASAAQALAEQGLDAALDQFIRELPLDPSLRDELLAGVQSFYLEYLAFLRVQSVYNGDVAAGVQFYAALGALNRADQVAASTWNSICWYGSLWDQGPEVLEICELAVELDPTNGGIRDSRALARALSGDPQGAIEDFNDYIAWYNRLDSDPNAEPVALRREWVRALESGENPFDAATLEALREE